MFHVSFFMTLRYQFFPWGWEDWSELKNRWYLLMVVAMCILAFGFIPSGISTLLVPTPFQRTALLMGTELDFASSDPACLSWIRDHSPIRDRCMMFVSRVHGSPDIGFTKTSPQIHNSYNYTSCLVENQLLDVLDSGRNNVSRSLIVDL